MHNVSDDCTAQSGAALKAMWCSWPDEAKAWLLRGLLLAVF
jgi:hypothetical protein